MARLYPSRYRAFGVAALAVGAIALSLAEPANAEVPDSGTMAAVIEPEHSESSESEPAQLFPQPTTTDQAQALRPLQPPDNSPAQALSTATELAELASSQELSPALPSPHPRPTPIDAPWAHSSPNTPSTDTLYWSPARPDSHAPIGVMGDHTHGQGEIMLSYRYMYMDMDGNRSGRDTLTPEQVLQQFPVTPTRMTMQMHMLGAMYAPSDTLTLMVMAPYIIKEMDHLTRMGTRFTTRSQGFGDISLSGLYTVFDRARQRLHLNLGFSVPTGSIEERDATPMGPDQILPYPMQIGSGTVDLQPGITYLGQAGDWSWGTQAMGTLRLGENSNGYRLGNQLALTAWGARQWANWFSTSLRLAGRTWGNIDGQDSRLNPSLVPTADPSLRAGTQLDLGLGLNFYIPEGQWSGTRAAVEVNLPLYRNLSGPQLETDFSITAGVQASF